MRNYPTRFIVFLWTLCALLAASVAWAQDETDLGEAAQPIQEMRTLKNKTVVFVFDVSGSMNEGGNLRRAREAAIRILREGTSPGDRAALFTFGAGYKKVFDKTIADSSDKADLIDQIPTQTDNGAGTNIRRPHHESLKILDAALPHEGIVVLLTDSFNDEPKPSDPPYQDYLRYYTPGGRLTKYPNTPENRDYERLLAKLNASGKFHQYGIGVGIGTDGRPNERLPQAAPPPVEETPAPVTTNAPPPAPGPNIPWLWLALGAGVLIAGTVAVLPLLRTNALRITGGPSGVKDFQIKNGQEIRLGGSSASAASFDAYALPVSTKDPVAIIRAKSGRLILSPTPVMAGNQNPVPRVYHNGQILEKDETLLFGDEVRVSVPDASTGGLGKECRLKFDDPKKSF